MKYIASVFAVGSLALSAHGATYTVGNNQGTNSSPIVTSNGTYLTGNGANGTVIGSLAFGFFSSDNAVTTATSMTSLLAAFTQFGAAGSFLNAGPSTPNINGVGSRNNTVSGAAYEAFAGRNIYFLVGNAASLADSTEVLVLKSNTTFGLSSAEPITASVTFDTANSDYTVIWGSKAGPSLGVNPSDATPEPSFQLAPIVPEPSSMLLGLIGLAGLLRRRRN